MNLKFKSLFITLILALSLCASVWSYCPSADLNGDCNVDIEDLVQFSWDWLVGSNPLANLDGQPGVNSSDFAILAEQWQSTGQPITLVINEFMADNSDFFFDSYGDADDWIELYNYGAEAIDIGGMYITDDQLSLTPYQIPATSPEQTTIAAGGYLILWADREMNQGPLHVDFKLSASGGEDIVLLDSNRHLITRFIDFGPQATNHSYGRYPDGGTSWQDFVPDTASAPTPNQSNGGRLPEDGILITELMYHPYNDSHPLVEDIREEYLEIYNSSFSAVNLEHWRITDGVTYQFPAISLEPGEYLVIASDPNIFQLKYPDVTNMIGGWEGRLSNSGEKVELTNALGKVIDQVRYADQGEWAQRILGPIDNYHRGWKWADEHDGLGYSLELTNTTLSNEYGSLWRAGTELQGTPGRKNSTDLNDRTGGAAPVITSARHKPFVPRDNDMVTVTAEVIDEAIESATVLLYYRIDGQPSFDAIAMSVDPLSDTLLPGHRLYTATLPSQPDKTVVEFYVEAADIEGNIRTMPAPCNVDGSMEQRANCLYQVDNSYDPQTAWQPGSQPIYRIIMTEAERAELNQIGLGTNSTEEQSDAQMNATFISLDGVDMKMRYNVGVRNRGHGTRTSRPNNYRVNFRTDDPWKEVVAINLNTQYTWLQLTGSALFQRCGLATGDATAVQVRVNGNNLANSGSPQYGSYVHIEAINSEYADHQFPGNGAGNAYKCLRVGTEADLRYEGQNPDTYRSRYSKETNESQDDWSDLIELTYVLNMTSDEQYIEELNRVVNVEQWLRFLALNIMLDNSETTLANGNGDDYYLYRGSADTRFILTSTTWDSILGQGQSIGSATAEIFPFMSGSGDSAIAALQRMVSHPQLAGRYYGHLKDLCDTILAPEQFDPFMDNLLSGFVPAQTINAIKSWMVTRRAHVLSLIPSEFTVETNLTKTGDYYQTGADMVALNGTADAIHTRSILVNGLPAQWSALSGIWSLGEGSGGVEESMIIPRGSSWQYLDDGSNQGTAWQEINYDDSSWKGPQATQLGYGDGDETSPAVTYIDTDPGTSGTQKNITTYFRMKFEIDDPSQYTNLRIGLLCDDGGIVYLNGHQICTYNLSTTPVTYTTPADQAISGGDEDVFNEYNINTDYLVSGTNILAVEIHQANQTSSDLSFDFEMAGILDTSNVIDGVPIHPGITRILVQAYDGPAGSGHVIDSQAIDVWQNSSTPTEISGTLTQDTTLIASEGPYMITGDLIVPSGILLIVEPGTTLFFNSGTGITVNGTLQAEGNEYAHIRMAPNPQSATRWDGIAIRNTLTDNRLQFVDMEFGDGQGDSIIVNQARAFMNYMTFTSTNSSTALMELTHPSAVIRNCVFPSISGTEPLHGTGLSGDEYLIFDQCTFGISTGYNDIMDFTGGQRPGPIIQFYNNLWLGGGDDGPDLDSTDAHIEGNLFTNFHQNSSSDSTSNAIATGDGSEVCIVRNVFINNEHCILHKEDVYTWVQNNVFIDTEIADVSFGEPFRNPPRTPGRGTYMDSNIHYNSAALFEHFFDNPADYGPTGPIYIYRSILPQQWHYLGSDNLDTDPMFIDFPADLGLQTGSPAIGTGINGLDRGYLVPAGASISGEPDGIANSAQATLQIGGPGIISYSYRLVDNDIPGAWSNEILLPINADDFPVDPDNILGVLEITGLEHGHTYRVDVLGRNSAGLWQGQTVGINTGFMTPGDPQGTPSRTWTVDLTAAPALSSGDQPVQYTPPAPAMAGYGYITEPQIPLLPADSTITLVGGSLTTDTIWSAQNGPYQVTTTLIVPVDVTLTIEAGTTVFFDPGAELTVYGKLSATGTGDNLIHFTRSPFSAGIWNGIQLINTQQDNYIGYAVIGYAETNNGAIGLSNASALLEYLSWTGSKRRLVRADNASLIVRNCVFPDRFSAAEYPAAGDDNLVEDIKGSGILTGGHFIIENNIFGANKGHNDIIDFSGPGLPGPILQVLNNVFMGSGDECLDLGGDAWIEGNLFMHVHKDVYNTGTGDSNVVSTGDDDYDAVVTMVRNVFYDIDHVIDLKTGTYLYFEHNTVVGIPDDTPTTTFSVFKFLIPNRDPEGRGAWLDSNIFYDIPQRIFENVDQSLTGEPGFVTDLVMNNCLLPAQRAGDSVGQRLGTIMDLGSGNTVGDPLFVDPAGNFQLRPESPAIAAAPDGLDLGAMVPAGAAIQGVPQAYSWNDTVTLHIGGPGITAYRYRLNQNSWSGAYPVTEPVILSGLSDGVPYTVEAIGLNRAEQWQSDQAPTVSPNWIVDSSYSRLILNEVLAKNVTVLEKNAAWPDLIELYYDGAETLDLAGFSLTDIPTNPTKFVFPAGSQIESGQYLVLYADTSLVSGEIHTGFALDDKGEGLYLFNPAGLLLDSVVFGLQIADLSIGRNSRGDWQLCAPTLGNANIQYPQGDPANLRINEWLCNGDVLFLDDFVELYNASAWPVNIGGLYITDNPVSQPEKYQLAPLNFVPGQGYAVFDADAQNDPGHFPFRLSADLGHIALFESDSREIDWVVYGPQTSDFSQGLLNEDGRTYSFFSIPTPGIANPVTSTAETIQLNLIQIDDSWRYNQNDNDLQTAWRETGYDDSSWPQGNGLLYVEGSTLPAVKSTPLTIGAQTYYFRGSFTLPEDIDLADILTLDLATVIDDAAVIYINGVEAFRIGFNSDTTVTHSTWSDRSVDNATYEYASLDPSQVILQPGENTIAVEVHQVTPGSSDIVFGLALDTTILQSQSVDDPYAFASQLLSDLRITEIMYHPAESTDLEFIELRNIGQQDLDITGVRLDVGVTFTCPAMTLAAGEYTIIVNDRTLFEASYGTELNIAGEFQGNLSNGGENLVLRLPDPLQAAILRIDYKDTWYPATDGSGYSLVARDDYAPPADWNRMAGWMAGSHLGGSPCAGE